MGAWRAGASGVLAISMVACLAVWSTSHSRGGERPVEDLAAVAGLGAKLATVKALAGARKGRADAHLVTAPGTKLADENDQAVAVAAAVKSVDGDTSAEGGNLGDGDMPDMDAIKKVQAAVKAAADAEVDDAVAASKDAATSSYAASREHFMQEEAKNPNAVIDGAVEIYPKEGTPGRPVGYKAAPAVPNKRLVHGTLPARKQQRLARSEPAGTRVPAGKRDVRGTLRAPLAAPAAERGPQQELVERRGASSPGELAAAALGQEGSFADEMAAVERQLAGDLEGFAARKGGAGGAGGSGGAGGEGSADGTEGKEGAERAEESAADAAYRRAVRDLMGKLRDDLDFVKPAPPARDRAPGGRDGGGDEAGVAEEGAGGGGGGGGGGVKNRHSEMETGY
jgi:hypothetical protein